MSIHELRHCTLFDNFASVVSRFDRMRTRADVEGLQAARTRTRIVTSTIELSVSS